MGTPHVSLIMGSTINNSSLDNSYHISVAFSKVKGFFGRVSATTEIAENNETRHRLTAYATKSVQTIV